jgi:membrane fusion protein (multidrug efflux system)
MQLTIGGSAALLLLLVIPAVTRAESAAEAVSVRAAPVTRGTVIDTETFLGSLTALHNATVAAQTAGTITEVFVRSGQKVKQGDPLFQFDTRAARADVEIAQARVRVTEGALRRAQELMRSGNTPQSRLDELNADNATGRAQLNAAQVRLDILTLRAPFDARAGVVQLSPGTFVQLGDPLVQLTDDTHLVVDFRVPQSHLPQLRLGGPIQISGRALGQDRVLDGRVTIISPQADRNSRAVDVRAEVDTGGHPMTSGIAVRVDLTVAQREGQPIVPAEALMPGMVTDQAYRIQQGIARLVQVRTGTRRDGHVEVLSGLEVGDLVVTLGQFRLQDGAAVRVVADGQPSAVERTSSPVTVTPATAERR